MRILPFRFRISPNLIIWGRCPLSIRVPADFLVILSSAVRLLFCLHISLEISIFLSIVSFYWRLLSKYFVLYILWFLHPTWSHYSSLTITFQDLWLRHNVMVNTGSRHRKMLQHSNIILCAFSTKKLVQVSRWNIYLEPSCSKVNIWLSHNILSLKHSINSCAGDDVNVTFLTSWDFFVCSILNRIHCLQWRYTFTLQQRYQNLSCNLGLQLTSYNTVICKISV